MHVEHVDQSTPPPSTNLLPLGGVLVKAGVGRVSLAEVALTALGVLRDDPVLVDGVRVRLGEDGPGANPAAGAARLDRLGVSGLPVDGELEVLPHLVEERLLVTTCCSSECSLIVIGKLTFSSTRSFRLFQENSKTAIMMDMNIPPTRTMKTPPRLARLS